MIGVSKELIASDVLDHFRTYSLLEKLLSNPNKLQEQLSFQIEPQTRQLLIEKFVCSICCRVSFDCLVSGITISTIMLLRNCWVRNFHQSTEKTWMRSRKKLMFR